MSRDVRSQPSSTGAGLSLFQARVGEIPLDRESLTIGSQPGCDVQLDREGVAPQHCSILRQAGGYRVLAHSPMTWLNEIPLREANLKLGDRLIVGPIEFTVCQLQESHQPVPTIQTSLSDSQDSASAITSQSPADLPASSPLPTSPLTDSTQPLLSRQPGALQATQSHHIPQTASRHAGEPLSGCGTFNQSRQRRRETTPSEGSASQHQTTPVRNAAGPLTSTASTVEPRSLKSLEGLVSRLLSNSSDDVPRSAELVTPPTSNPEVRQLLETRTLEQLSELLLEINDLPLGRTIQQEVLQKLGQRSLSLDEREAELRELHAELHARQQELNQREHQWECALREVQQLRQARSQPERLPAKDVVNQVTEAALRQRTEALDAREAELQRRGDAIALEEAVLQHRLSDCETRSQMLDDREAQLTMREKEIATREADARQLVSELAVRKTDLDLDLVDLTGRLEALALREARLSEAQRLHIEQQTLLQQRETEIVQRAALIDQQLSEIVRQSAELERRQSELQTQRHDLANDLTQLDHAQQELRTEQRLCAQKAESLQHWEEQLLRQQQSVLERESTLHAEADVLSLSMAGLTQREAELIERESHLKAAEQLLRENEEALHIAQEQHRQECDERENTLARMTQEWQSGLTQFDTEGQAWRDQRLAEERELEQMRCELEQYAATLAEKQLELERMQADIEDHWQDLEAARESLQSQQNELEQSRWSSPASESAEYSETCRPNRPLSRETDCWSSGDLSQEHTANSISEPIDHPLHSQTPGDHSHSAMLTGGRGSSWSHWQQHSATEMSQRGLGEGTAQADVHGASEERATSLTADRQAESDPKITAEDRSSHFDASDPEVPGGTDADSDLEPTNSSEVSVAVMPSRVNATASVKECRSAQDEILELRSQLAELFGIESLQDDSDEQVSAAGTKSSPDAEQEIASSLKAGDPLPLRDSDSSGDRSKVQSPHVASVERCVETAPVSSHEHDTVESYWERLLQRTRRVEDVPSPDVIPPQRVGTTVCEPQDSACGPELVEYDDQHAVTEQTPDPELAAGSRRSSQMDEQQRRAIREHMSSLRVVANQSARSAVAKHVSQQMLLQFQVKGLITLVSTIVALAFLSSPLWSNISYFEQGLAAACIAVLIGTILWRDHLKLSELAGLTTSEEDLSGADSEAEASVEEGTAEEHSESRLHSAHQTLVMETSSALTPQQSTPCDPLQGS